VVEDHDDSRRFLQQLLESAGARVVVAEDGRVALLRLQHIHPDIVLADLLMPELDGLALARRLKAEPRWAAIPLLAVTALGEAADYIQTWAHGFAGHITKPVDPEQLIAAIQRIARPAR